MLAVGRCIQGLLCPLGDNHWVMVSPFLGGLVYDRAGYYPVFYFCLGVIALVFLFRVSVVERKTAAKYEKVPSMADEAGHAPSAEHDVESQTRSLSLAFGSGRRRDQA